VAFSAPEGLSYAEIDRDTGGLATPGCPRTIVEAFLPATEPHELCYLHGGTKAKVGAALGRLQNWLKRIIR
jgi:hypothetical protein